MSETNPPENPRDPNGPAPDGKGTEGGATGNPAGEAGARPAGAGENVPPAGHLGGGGEDADEGPVAGEDDGEAGSPEIAGDNRSTLPRRAGAYKGAEAADVARAMREAEGDRKLAAAALGITTKTLAHRINANSQLRALWGGNVTIEGPETPTETNSLNRQMNALPGLTPESVELAQMVSESDNELLRKGLAKLGVSEKMIKRLKTLDGLAQSSGHFLSVSLEKTHRLYFLQLIGLHEVADSLRERLMAAPGEDGYIANDEARAMFNRNYADYVKESGNGYKLMMEGASAMVRMLQAAKGDEEGHDGPGKPKWSRTKRVNPSEPNAKD